MQPTDNTIPASIMNAIEQTKPVIARIGMEVWDKAELSQEEHKSAQIHIRELEAAGFRITRSRERAAMKQRLWRSGAKEREAPRSGFCRSMTRCRDLGMSRWRSRSRGATGIRTGTGADTTRLVRVARARRLLLKLVLENEKIPGTIRVYGCAAEEKEGVKVQMARDGLFNDLDGALAFHPAPLALVGYVRTAAVNYKRGGVFRQDRARRSSAVGGTQRAARGGTVRPWVEPDEGTRRIHDAGSSTSSNRWRQGIERGHRLHEDPAWGCAIRTANGWTR